MNNSAHLTRLAPHHQGPKFRKWDVIWAFGNACWPSKFETHWFVHQARSSASIVYISMSRNVYLSRTLQEHWPIDRQESSPRFVSPTLKDFERTMPRCWFVLGLLRPAKLEPWFSVHSDDSWLLSVEQPSSSSKSQDKDGKGSLLGDTVSKSSLKSNSDFVWSISTREMGSFRLRDTLLSSDDLFNSWVAKSFSILDDDTNTVLAVHILIHRAECIRKSGH